MKKKLIKIGKIIKPSPKLREFLESIGEKYPEQGSTLENLLKRPAVKFYDLNNSLNLFEGYTKDIFDAVEVDVKYSGYIDRQYQQIEQERKLEERRIPADMDYSKLEGLRLEAREKLEKIKPLTVGMASRISGVSPADITVLLMYLK